MNVGELFHSLDRDAVLEFVAERYDEQADMPHYRRAWAAIVGLQPEPTDLICVLRRVHQDGTETSYGYVEVSGRKAGSTETYGIEFVPWGQWLSMDVECPADGAPIEPVEVLGHVLQEMTWCGYDQEEIERRAEGLREAVEEIRQDHPQGRAGPLH